MGTSGEHVTKATANVTVARKLNTTNEADWKVIASFYAALHYVEAAIVDAGLVSSNHTTRADNMRRVPRLAKKVSDYETLRNYAQIARYDAAVSFSAKPDQVQIICDLADSLRKDLGY